MHPELEQVVDQMVLDRCCNVEYEIGHHVNRDGPRIERGLMTRPTEQESGIKALVLWGMIQLAKTET